MSKFIIKDIGKEISDALIWQMAFLGCVPAFYEYASRATRKAGPKSKLASLHKSLINSGVDIPLLAIILALPKNELVRRSRELTLITSKLYKSPVRALISPLNSEKNNKMLAEERLGLKIEHVIDDVNKSKFRFTNNEEKLINRDYFELKASLLFLNWFLVKPTYARPNIKNITYMFSMKNIRESDFLSRSAFFEKLGSLSKLKSHEISYLKNELYKNSSSRSYIRLSSSQLNTYLNNISKDKINSIARSYSAIYEMDLIDDEILDRLPIFVMLNKRNYQSFLQITKLYKLGYTRMLHLRFLRDECLEKMLDKKLKPIINKLIIH
jgi:hypothetical protein